MIKIQDFLFLFILMITTKELIQKEVEAEFIKLQTFISITAVSPLGDRTLIQQIVVALFANNEEISFHNKRHPYCIIHPRHLHVEVWMVKLVVDLKWEHWMKNLDIRAWTQVKLQDSSWMTAGSWLGSWIRADCQWKDTCVCACVYLIFKKQYFMGMAHPPAWCQTSIWLSILKTELFIILFIILFKHFAVDDLSPEVAILQTAVFVWHSIPLEVLPHCFIEFDIKGPIKLLQLLYDLLFDLYVSPALGLPEAAGLAAALGLLQAGEAFGSVKVEVLVSDYSFQSQKVLDAAHFTCRISDQPLPAHKVHLRQAKVLQPVLQVQDIHPDPNGIPRGVNEAQTSVLKGQLLKRRDVWLLGESLCVVGDCSCDGVAHHDNQLGLTGHAGDASWRLLGDKVAGSLLQSNLAVERSRHQSPWDRNKRLSQQEKSFSSFHMPFLLPGWVQGSKHESWIVAQIQQTTCIYSALCGSSVVNGNITKGGEEQPYWDTGCVSAKSISHFITEGSKQNINSTKRKTKCFLKEVLFSEHW